AVCDKLYRQRLGYHLLPPLRVSFLRPIGPELLEKGPEVCDVLVVLDADKCHAGARHVLHRRADIFGESFLAPRDAGRFIGRGIVETVEGAALAAIDAVERGTELDFGVRPDLVAGGAQSPEHLLAGSGVLPHCRSGRSCKSHSSNHPYLQHLFSLNAIDVAPHSLSSDERSDLLNARVQSSRRRLRNSADELARPIGRTAIGFV